MDLRHLKYVIAVAEELHFTRAANRLGIGQPPLSQQIKQLEEELGTPLFIRATRTVSLTEAGRAFLPYARAALNAAEQAALAAKRAARGELGQMRIGFTSAASFNSNVPAIISRFRDAYPEVELSLVEQATNYLVTGLHTGKLDIAFIRPAPGQCGDLVTFDLPPEPLWIALPSRHPLSSSKVLHLRELANDAFVLYPRINGSVLYDTIIEACRMAGYSPRIVQEAPQMSSTVNLVAAGVGVALVPESMCQLHPEGVAYVQIAAPQPCALLCIAHRQTDKVPFVVSNFMKHAGQFFER
jgi:DNA-binding transcriptional LysR family regulator